MDSPDKDILSKKERSENVNGGHTKYEIMKLIYEELCNSEIELDAILRQLRVSKNII